MPLSYLSLGAPRPFRTLPLGWFEGPDALIYYKGSRQTVSLADGEACTMDPDAPCTPVALL